MDRGSEWAFFKETQMANKHTKRVQCHLITREIKVRNTMRYHSHLLG